MLDPITFAITPIAIILAVLIVLLVTLFFAVIVQRATIKDLRNEIRYYQAKNAKRPKPPVIP